MRLGEVDEGIVSFINYMRNTMNWFEKQLDYQEVETLFGFLDEAHNYIIDEIRKIVNSFQKDDVYGL